MVTGRKSSNAFWPSQNAFTTADHPENPFQHYRLLLSNVQMRQQIVRRPLLVIKRKFSAAYWP